MKPIAQRPGQAAWLPPAAARPLHWWDAGTLHAAGQSLAAALRDWCEAWGWPGPLPQAALCSLSPRHEWQGAWQVFERAGAPVAWALLPSPPAAQLLAGFFPDAQGAGPVAQAFACAGEQDALTRVAAVLDAVRAGLPAAPPALQWRAGAGALEVRLDPPFGWRLLLAAAAVSGWRASRPPGAAPGARPALSCVDAALASKRLELHVALDGCQLELAALRALQPGDIVRLRHPIDTPAALRDSAGSTLCRAYLGRCRGSVAVELAAG